MCVYKASRYQFAGGTEDRFFLVWFKYIGSSVYIYVIPHLVMLCNTWISLCIFKHNDHGN